MIHVVSRSVGRFNKLIILAVIALSGFAIAVPALFEQSVHALNTVSVTPNSHSPWTTDSTTSGGAVSFVSDGSAPLGNGALLLTTDSTTASKAQYTQYFSPVPLSSVNTLSYSTKQNSASFSAGDPAYQLYVWVNGTSGFDTFTYEPYVNQGNSAVHQGEWQSWNVAAGSFYSSHDFTGTGGSVVTSQGSSVYTLAQLQSYFPNAVVIGIGINVGSNNPSYNVEADAMNFNGTTYDFDPNPVTAPVNLVLKDGSQGYSVINPGLVSNTHNPVNAQLSWDPVAGATGYSVQVYKNGVQVGGSSFGWNGSWVGFAGNNYGSGDGSYTFVACAIDGGGHSVCSNATPAYIIDTTAPSIQPVTFTNLEHNNSPLQVSSEVAGTTTFTVSQTEANPSSMYVEYDQLVNNKWQKRVGQSFAGNTGSITIDTSQWGDGTYQVKVSSNDMAGYHSGLSQSFTVDNTSPQVSLNLANGQVVGGVVAIAATDVELHPSINYITVTNGTTHATQVLLNDNTAIQNPTVNWTTNGLPDGTYTVYYEAKDLAGNDSHTSVDVTVDNTAPVVTGVSFTDANHTTPTSLVASTTLRGTATFTVNQNEPHPNKTYVEYDYLNPSTNKYQKQTGEWFYGTNTDNLVVNTDTSGWPDGIYQIKVSTWDALNNQSGYSQQFKVDNTAPVVTISNIQLAGTSPSISGTINDPTALVNVIIDGQSSSATNNGDGSWIYNLPSALGEGTYQVSVVATDSTGNSSSPVTEQASVSPSTVTTTTTTTRQVQTNFVPNNFQPTSTNTVPGNTDTGVLGDSTTTPSSSSSTTPNAGVKGDSTTKNVASAATDGNKGKIFGIAWYWWLLLLAVIGLVWWIVAARRRGPIDEL